MQEFDPTILKHKNKHFGHFIKLLNIHFCIASPMIKLSLFHISGSKKLHLMIFLLFIIKFEVYKWYYGC
jgi:hypothetical protein